MDQRLKRMLVTMFLVYLIGVGAFRYLEDWSWIDSLYFTAVSMTTIGYGDIYPTHDLSKVFAILFGIVSVGLWFYIITTIAENRFYKKLEEREK